MEATAGAARRRGATRNREALISNLRSLNPSRWLEAIASLVILIAVLLSNPYSSEAFEGNRFVFSWLLAGLLMIPLTATARQRRRDLYQDPLTLAALAFLATTALAMATSILPARSFWGVPPRLHGGLTVTALVVILLACRPLADRPRARRRLARGLVFAVSVAAAYGVCQHFGFDPIRLAEGWPDRVTGTQGNPIFFGAVLALGAPWTLAELLRHRGARAVALGALLALQLLALWWTGSRGPQLAAGLGMVTTALALYRTKVQRRWWIAAAVALAALGLGALFGLQERGWKTVTERQLIWATTLEIYQQAPARRQLFGHGPDTFPWVVSPELPAELPATAGRPDATYDRAHQTLLQLAVETGILGVLAWLSLLGIAFARLIRRPLLTAVGSLAGGVVAGGILGWIAAAERVALGIGLGGLTAALVLLLVRAASLPPSTAAMIGSLLAAFAHGLVAPRSTGAEILLWLLLALFVPRTVPSPAQDDPEKGLSLIWVAGALAIMMFGLWTPPQVAGGLRIGPWIALLTVAGPAFLVGVVWTGSRPGLTTSQSRAASGSTIGLLAGLVLFAASLAAALPKLDAFAHMRRGDAAFTDRQLGIAAAEYGAAVERFESCDSCRLAAFRARIQDSGGDALIRRGIDAELAAAARKNPYEANYPRERAYLQARSASRAGDRASHQRHVAAAERHFAQAAELAPTDARLLRLWANLELEEGRPGQARNRLEKAVALSPDSPDGHLLLARAQLDLGQTEDAWTAVRRALDLHPERVKETVSAVANARPPRWRALRDWALVAAVLGRGAEGREVLERARRLAPPSERDRLIELEKTLLARE
ncbi:MAG: O-antigen ligase family protein [Acidobacteriota bacterium]